MFLKFSIRCVVFFCVEMAAASVASTKQVDPPKIPVSYFLKWFELSLLSSSPIFQIPWKFMLAVMFQHVCCLEGKYFYFHRGMLAPS